MPSESDLFLKEFFWKLTLAFSMPTHWPEPGFLAIPSYKGVQGGEYCRLPVSLVEEGKGEGSLSMAFGNQFLAELILPVEP